MDKIKYIVQLLKKSYDLTSKDIFIHNLKYGYVMIQLKKKFKNKKQLSYNKAYQYKNKEKFNEMKRIQAHRLYNTNPNYAKLRMEYYYNNKEKISLQKKEYYNRKKQLLVDIQL